MKFKERPKIVADHGQMIGDFIDELITFARLYGDVEAYFNGNKFIVKPESTLIGVYDKYMEDFFK